MKSPTDHATAGDSFRKPLLCWTILARLPVFWVKWVLLTGLTRVARENILVRWQEDIAKLARYPNVYIKMSGLFMPILSHQFHKQNRLASKQEVYDLALPLISHVLRHFGSTGSCLPSTFPWSGSSTAHR